MNQKRTGYAGTGRDISQCDCEPTFTTSKLANSLVQGSQQLATTGDRHNRACKPTAEPRSFNVLPRLFSNEMTSMFDNSSSFEHPHYFGRDLSWVPLLVVPEDIRSALRLIHKSGNLCHNSVSNWFLGGLQPTIVGWPRVP